MKRSPILTKKYLEIRGNSGNSRYLKPKIMDFNAFGVLCPGRVSRLPKNKKFSNKVKKSENKKTT